MESSASFTLERRRGGRVPVEVNAPVYDGHPRAFCRLFCRGGSITPVVPMMAAAEAADAFASGTLCTEHELEL